MGLPKGMPHTFATKIIHSTISYKSITVILSVFNSRTNNTRNVGGRGHIVYASRRRHKVVGVVASCFVVSCLGGCDGYVVNASHSRCLRHAGMETSTSMWSSQHWPCTLHRPRPTGMDALPSSSSCHGNCHRHGLIVISLWAPSSSSCWHRCHHRHRCCCTVAGGSIVQLQVQVQVVVILVWTCWHSLSSSCWHGDIDVDVSS